jgi:hypothetical protein
MTEFSPREIVSELDRYIVGHTEAKKAVAVALRNRWRRRRVPADLRDEVTPKNILLIGPTGVGKTEIARRLAKLAQAPFLKVEATKFTEVGYVGRDVDQIVRDLVESALAMVRDKRRAGVKAKAEAAAEERILDALTGPGSTAARDSFRKKLRAGELDDKEIELQLADTGGGGMFEIPGQPGASVLNLSEMMKSFGGGRTKTHKTTVAGAWAPLIAEESDKLLDQEALTQEALELAENHGIVFLDEIDKVASLQPARRRRRLPRGRAARPAAADRGHDGLDQVRAGEDRPHPVHRLGRLPRRQAVGPAARAAGPPADPRGAEGPDPRRPAPHPDRAGSQPDPPAPGPDADRGRDPDLHRRRHRRRGRRGRGGERLGREHRRPPAADHPGEGGRGDQLLGGRPRGETVTIDAAYVQERIGALAANADLSRFIL